MTTNHLINHLRKLGFNGDLTEIEKMYAGKPFNRQDPEYQNLLKYSNQLCSEYSELNSIPYRSASPSVQKMIDRKRNDILDKLFPGHGLIIGVGDNISAVVGMVNLKGITYINHNVTFSPDTLVESGDFCLFAPNVCIGNRVENSQAAGRVTIGDDVWICADVSVGNNTIISSQSVIGLGSKVLNDTTIDSNSLYVGVPAQKVLNLTPDYQTQTGQKQRSQEEIDYLINHLKMLGFDGDFTEYIKMLNGEKYNSIQSVISQISDFTHNLCAEYNNSKTPIERKKEIVNILFPYKGKNCKFGDKLFVDVIGSVSLGDNVIIGDGVSLAGNVRLGNNVVVGDGSTLFATGHEVAAQGRRLGKTSTGELEEINTTGYIEVEDGVKIGNNVKIVPNVRINSNIPSNNIYTKHGSLISIKDENIMQ
ncbi:MAG: hypothetical protein IJA61_03055 [Clostridia bacterium]|nr:hypothetical protein [Clostridia bacterium]